MQVHRLGASNISRGDRDLGVAFLMYPGSREPGAWRQASSRFSRHVPAGELGVLKLLGAGRSVRPGEKRSSGAWGGVTARRGRGASLTRPFGLLLASRLCPRWQSEGTPETRPPHPQCPLIARSPHRCTQLTACRASYSNSCESRGLVRRKPGTGRGRAGAGLLPADPADPVGLPSALLPSWRGGCGRLRPPLAPWHV